MDPTSEAKLLDTLRRAHGLLETACDAHTAETAGIITTPERRELVLGLIKEAKMEIERSLSRVETRELS